MDRGEYIAYTKARALDYVDMGDNSLALSSLISDLRHNPETENHAAMLLGTMLMVNGHLSTDTQMRDFINGIQ